MKSFGFILVAATTFAANSALACSAAELQQKQKAYGDAVKVAFARDPSGDAARRQKAEGVIARYAASLKGVSHGATIIDTICRENEELLAIYK